MTTTVMMKAAPRLLKKEDETNVRRHLEVIGRELGYHVSHIESPITSPGIPDLVMCKGKDTLWLEFKVLKRGGIHMRPSQRRWHREHSAAGGVSWVLAYIEGHIYPVRGSEAVTLLPKSLSWRSGERYGLGEAGRLLGDLAGLL